MFAIKDIESVKNLAGVLVIPFFTAAYISDGTMNKIRDPLFDWLRSQDSCIISAFGWAFWLLTVVAVVTMAIALFDTCVVWLHVKLGDTFVMLWFGFAFLAAGILVLSFAMPGLPKSPLNPLWHISLFCYGFTLIDRAGKSVK